MFIINTPLLEVVSDEALVGNAPVLAFINSTSLLACFNSDFKAASVACLVTPLYYATAVMATRIPMMTMTMRSSMIVKPRETVEVLEELRELKALEMMGILFGC